MLDKSFCPILNKWLWTTTIFINDIPLVLYTSSRWTSYQSKYRFTRYFIFPQSTLYFLQRFIIGSLSSKYLWTNMGQNWALCTIIKPPFNCTSLVQIFGGFSSIWWIWRGSNSLPHRCERCALPGELQTQARYIIYQPLLIFQLEQKEKPLTFIH